MQSRYLITAALIAIVGLAWTGTATADPLKYRMVNQHYRIKDGVASGALTYWEARHLRQKHRQIRRMRHHFLADGRLSHRERRILIRRLNHNSDRISAFKHNRHFY